MTHRLVHLFLPLSVGACAVIGGSASSDEPAPVADSSRTYANAAEREDHQCHSLGACDRYVLGFAPGTRVRIEMRATSFTPVIVGKHGKHSVGAPGRPAIAEFVVKDDAPIRILAASKNDDRGDYELIVSPAPLVESELPKPKISDEERVARILERSKPDEAFSRAARQANAMQRERLANYTRLKVEVSASLENFAAVELPVEAGWCYKISYRLERGASFSELATRGLRGVVKPPKGNHRFSTRLEVIDGRRGVMGHVCLDVSGSVTFALRAERAPSEMADALGTGALTVALHRQKTPHWVGLASKSSLAKAIRAETKGYRAAKSFKFDLSTDGSRKLQFKRGKCYVLVVKLNRGASWSDAVSQRNINVNFEGPSGGINAGPGVLGPGAISAPGCVFTGGAYALTMNAYSKGSALGTGSASAKLYVRNARRGELRKLEREEREQIQQSDRDMARTAREHCRKCRESSSTKEELETCAATGGQARNACY